MLKEIRESQPEKSIKSCLGSGSPGEIRTLIWFKQPWTLLGLGMGSPASTCELYSFSRGSAAQIPAQTTRIADNPRFFNQFQSHTPRQQILLKYLKSFRHHVVIEERLGKHVTCRHVTSRRSSCCQLKSSVEHVGCEA